MDSGVGATRCFLFLSLPLLLFFYRCSSRHIESLKLVEAEKERKRPYTHEFPSRSYP